MLFSQHFYLNKERAELYFFWDGCNLQDDWVVWKATTPVCACTPQSWDKAVGEQLSGADKQNWMLSNKIHVSTRLEKQPNSPFISQLFPKPCFQTMTFQILRGCDGLVNIYPQNDFPHVSETMTWTFSSFLTSFLPGADHLYHHRTTFFTLLSSFHLDWFAVSFSLQMIWETSHLFHDFFKL